MQEALRGWRKIGEGNVQSWRIASASFSTFADLMPHLVFETDGECRLEYANEQWVEQMGPYEDITLPRLCERMLKEDRQPLLDAWERARVGGSQLNTLTRLMARSDQPQWFRVRARPVFGDSGAVDRWIGTLSNVNESVTAADSVEKALGNR